VMPAWAGTALAFRAAETRSGQPSGELKTNTPTTPVEFATPSAMTVSVYGSGEVRPIAEVNQRTWSTDDGVTNRNAKSSARAEVERRKKRASGAFM
jgi:hypothetical protein